MHALRNVHIYHGLEGYQYHQFDRQCFEPSLATFSDWQQHSAAQTLNMNDHPHAYSNSKVDI